MDTMDTARPYTDVLPGPRGRLLATLVQLEAPVTVRALARYADVSPQGALSYVNALANAGILSSERVGAALMVSLNRQHLAADPLVALVRTRARLIERLSEELSEWRELAGAWLFGSTARGDGGPDSDMDLLLVAKSTTENNEWTEATSRLRERAGLWTGNEVQLIEHTKRSFASLVESENPLVAAIRAEGIPLTPGTRAFLRNVA